MERPVAGDLPAGRRETPGADETRRERRRGARLRSTCRRDSRRAGVERRRGRWPHPSDPDTSFWQATPHNRMWPSGRARDEHRPRRSGEPRLELEAVLRGWAPDAPARELHRRTPPARERMVRRAWHNYRADNAILPDPALEDPARRPRPGPWQAADHGHAVQRVAFPRRPTRHDYANSPLIVADGTPAPENDPDNYI